MKRVQVVYSVVVEASVPDDWCDRVRAMTSELGATYLPVDATDQQILERLAYIRGVKRLPYDEALTGELERGFRQV